MYVYVWIYCVCLHIYMYVCVNIPYVCLHTHTCRERERRGIEKQTEYNRRNITHASVFQLFFNFISLHNLIRTASGFAIKTLILYQNNNTISMFTIYVNWIWQVEHWFLVLLSWSITFQRRNHNSTKIQCHIRGMYQASARQMMVEIMWLRNISSLSSIISASTSCNRGFCDRRCKPSSLIKPMSSWQ